MGTNRWAAVAIFALSFWLQVVLGLNSFAAVVTAWLPLEASANPKGEREEDNKITMREGRRMYIVDRFEGDLAVIEYEEGKTFDLPRGLLPKGVKEGDVLAIQIGVDKGATEKRRKAMRDLLQFDE